MSEPRVQLSGGAHVTEDGDRLGQHGLRQAAQETRPDNLGLVHSWNTEDGSGANVPVRDQSTIPVRRMTLDR